MSTFPIAAIAAIFALLPISILAGRGSLERNALGWLLLAAALIGGSLPALAELQTGWRAGLAASLHVTVAATLVVFAAAVVLNAPAMRLAALVGPYALLLIVLGWIAARFEVEPPVPVAPGAWFAGHVLLAIAAYAALTLSALAACGVLLEERSFKARTDTWATRVLPPLAETEALQNALLKLSAILLLLALATGAANEFLAIGEPVAFTHKILLSFLGFGVVLILLVLHHRTGLRGRRAARWLLTGYLLLTLAYPGVKFVREILIGQG
ncbi:MAG TPA: cytochrome c biogenesis protein CcsA [Dongiaceae bacterium]